MALAKWEEAFIVFLSSNSPFLFNFNPPLSSVVSSPVYLILLSACLQKYFTETSLRFYHACFGHYITNMELLVQEK